MDHEKSSILLSDLTINGDIIEKEKVILDSKVSPFNKALLIFPSDIAPFNLFSLSTTIIHFCRFKLILTNASLIVLFAVIVKRDFSLSVNNDLNIYNNMFPFYFSVLLN